MAVGKRGIFYLFVAVVFTLSFLTILSIQGSYDYSESKEPVVERVRTIDDFISDFHNDASQATYIAGFRAFIAMEEEIALTGEYFDDAEDVFIEAFEHGTIDGRNKSILNKSSFEDYLARVTIEAREIGVDLNVSVHDVALFHVNPWTTAVNVTFNVSMRDTRSVASWEYQKTIRTDVPLFELRDPIYSVGTQGRAPNTIQRSNVTAFIDDAGDANDTTNLMRHTNESWYIASDDAPSYVMRLEGNLSSSQYGIESLVNVQELIDQGVALNGSRTILDYQYFGNMSNVTVCEDVINTPEWFRLAEDRLATYEVDTDLAPEGDGYVC